MVDVEISYLQPGEFEEYLLAHGGVLVMLFSMLLRKEKLAFLGSRIADFDWE